MFLGNIFKGTACILHTCCMENAHSDSPGYILGVLVTEWLFREHLVHSLNLILKAVACFKTEIHTHCRRAVEAININCVKEKYDSLRWSVQLSFLKMFADFMKMLFD